MQPGDPDWLAEVEEEKKISYLRREGRGLFLHVQVENALQLIENTRTQLSLCLIVEHRDILLSTLLLWNRSGYVDDESIPLEK